MIKELKKFAKRLNYKNIIISQVLQSHCIRCFFLLVFIAANQSAAGPNVPLWKKFYEAGSNESIT